MTDAVGRKSAPEKNLKPWLLLMSVLLFLALIGLGLLGYRVLERLDDIESQVTTLSTQTIEATDASERALARAERAEDAARAAAEGRLLAEAQAARAEEDAALARDDARSSRARAEASREEAEAAKAQAARIRREAEAELNRLEEALGQVAETRRTALGVVMNLGSLRFDFDKAELKPAARELLSRVAGILMTSSDYTVQINGHTDDVGSEEYNQRLSERRADSVRDYLVEAGIDETILSIEGHGKSQPLVEGTSEEARAKNRRVELGIVNTRITYPSARNR